MANKIKEQNIFDDVLTDEQYTNIDTMIKDFKKSKDMELEVSFRNISYASYMRISEHLANIVDENDISAQDSLDISIMLADNNTYRVSILDVGEIEKFIQRFSRSRPDEIQKYIISLKPSDDIEIMYKDRGSANRLYIDDFGTVFKLTRETPITKENSKPDLNGNEKMLYRYKSRYSFNINENVRIDITNVQESTNLWNLPRRHSNYEIEIEVVNKNIKIETLLSEVESVLKIIQDSDIPIGKKEASEVIQKYQTLLNVKGSHIDSRNVVSIETQHIVKFIPNKYAITDKADGERYFLFSTQDGVYLLSTNMVVKKLGIEINDKKFQNMLLDGELIKNEHGYMFLAFDVIYANGVDYRYNDKYILTHRLTVLNNIIDQCFGTLIPFTDYTDKNADLEIDKIKSFYGKELKSYWTAFIKEMKKSDGLFVSRKLYFVPYGIDSSEVFMYADMVWKLSVYSKLTPYKLDGIIYTPINTPYMIKVSPENLDTMPMEYKWKTPAQNSIDFYIKFEKDAKGNDAIYYDNAVVRADANAYKICTLHVGINRGGQEKPVPFKVNGAEQRANIYVTDGEATDLEGNVINDETVVEFIFDITKPDIDDAYKWIPLRTRYDKTESVQKYGKKYGNNLNIALRIWRTIINPITEENISTLGNPSTFQKEIDRMSKTVDVYNKQSFVYYQKKTGNAAGMRAFNNWIKSNMILTYCTGKHNVLDIGCGRGGDLIKFIYAGIDEYVGIDIDHNGLYVISDSAYNRYKNLRNTHKHIPQMYFIHADARARFNVKSQESVLSNMTAFNKKLIETHLSGNKKYNVINAQFTLHYYLSDELSWSNFCKNINDHLETNGYLLVTAFDGKLIYDRLSGKQKMTVSYTDNNGNKNIFFEINKVYNDNDKNFGVGMAIDLYNSLISNPGTYIREYLVFPEFLEQSLKKNCGLELVESDSFFNLFNLYKNYFTEEDMGEFSISDTSAKRHDEIRNFYLSLKPNNHSDVETDAALASFKFSMLNRYYVFKKTTKIDVIEPSRIVGMNHKINLGKVLTPYFHTNKMIIDPAKKSSQINKIYHAIRKRYAPVKPSVYLIRHTIPEDIVDNEVYRRNKLEFSKIKDGPDGKTLLIYKSPDKYFYPVYYQNNVYKDHDEFLQYRLSTKNTKGITYDSDDKYEKSGTYLLESNKIVNDLDVLVALSEKLKINRNSD
ncbi:mRNA-capping enzyme [Tupanvirus soda lake]|uniref:mRNA-capping enzyme n=2 Tax=Tupanvirus TaxID=2094720 RepID=A0A6N1NUL7_9VIRU|nr:mRNA-capping enzyme [Tupanvirus soda lake]QKU35216.1 mRNA-capping enzyme [Tupanvirus soda lake]